MSVANSKTRRAEPRTAADLQERGYKILAVDRNWWPNAAPTREEFAADPLRYGGRRPRPPMTYKVVTADGRDAARNNRDMPWVGMITGEPTRSAAHPRNRSGWFRAEPIGTYESRVAAAHAIIDALEAS